MPCYYPSKVSIVRKSLYSKRGTKDKVYVPCGNCLGCRAEQSRQWAVRMMHEAQMHKHSWFATLTYSDEELPEHGSLFPEDFSRFVARIRADHPPGTISYFGCGEYGDTTKRPHYHAIIFGAQFLDRVIHPDSNRSGIWWSQTLDNYWGHGMAEIGGVTMASASYVSGYVRKKQSKKDHPDAYLRVDPETGELSEVMQEFARMSLKPAIGVRWLEKYWRDVYPRDFVVVEGREAKPPRYYDKWMAFSDEKGGTKERREMMHRVRTKRWDECVQLTKTQLMAKEAIAKSRINLFAGRGAI